MNVIRFARCALRRSYATKHDVNKIGMKARLAVAGAEEIDLEDDEFADDADAHESNFARLAEVYDTNQRERTKNKAILKQQITESKYFKEIEPSFLTFIERDQIKTLHEQNPDEWTVERLSESFPALPETITKILKSNWTPNSVEKVLKYDNRVCQNWNDFREGTLVVNPMLKEHLEKFKERKIVLTDRELIAEKLVPPKVEFPEPQTKVFSSIVKDYVDQQQTNETDKKFISAEHNTDVNNQDLTVTATCDTYVLQDSKEDRLVVHNKQNRRQDKKPQSFDEFIQNNVQAPHDKSPEEGMVILNTYRKQVENADMDGFDLESFSNSSEKSQVEDSSNLQEDSLKNPSAIADRQENQAAETESKIQEKPKKPMSFNEYCSPTLIKIYEEGPTEKAVTLLCEYRNYLKAWKSKNESPKTTGNVKINNEENTAVIEKKASDISTQVNTVNENVNAVIKIQRNEPSSLDTYVKEWKKLTDTEVKYAKPIKIPKNVYKEGMTYRIKDCYYDYDGEFLFRIPGVRS